MYKVYILKSKIVERFYIGHTGNLEKRLSEHNRSKVKSTKAFIPWEIVYSESFDDKSAAFQREMQIKSYKSGNAFQRIITQSKIMQS